MVKYLWLRVAGAIMLALYTATATALDITEIATLGAKWIPLITFIGFVGIMFWIVYDLKKANEHLLDNRPQITVEPYTDRHTHYLKVHNAGAKGVFNAQIDLTSDDPDVWSLSHYNGYWRYGKKDEARILKGQEDFLQIAELYTSRPPGIISQHLNICYHNPRLAREAPHTGGESYVSTSSHWLGATIKKTDGSSKPITKHKYKLHVIISSYPEPRDGIYEGYYVLTVDGLEIDIPNFQSTPDREGSETK